MKNLSWKVVTVITVLVAGFIYVIPTLKPGLWPYKKINLGLDLQGGMHLVLEVDTDQAVKSTLERIYEEMRHGLRAEKIHHGSMDLDGGDAITVTFNDTAEVNAFEAFFERL